MNPMPSRGMANLVFGGLIIAGLLQTIFSIWQHVAVIALASLGGLFKDQGVSFLVGSAAMGLSWTASFLILLTAFGLRVTLDSIVVLTVYEDDTEDDMEILLRPRGAPRT